MIVGNMIKEIRENAGLTQEQFAEKLAISRQAVSKWERGVALPDIENILFISDHFNVSLDTIVKGDKKMTNKVIADSKNAKIMNKLFIGIIVVAIAIIAFILGSGGMLPEIVPLIFDPKAIIIIVIFPLLFQYIMYGRFFLNAFSVFSKTEKESEIWKKAEDFFNNYTVALWMTVILILSIDFILLLRFLESKDGLGPGLFFMANTIITAGFINLVIITPYKIKIRQNLIKMENSEKIVAYSDNK
jgi:transcriptional regulator with XRE-family HTH domain